MAVAVAVLHPTHRNIHSSTTACANSEKGIWIEVLIISVLL